MFDKIQFNSEFTPGELIEKMEELFGDNIANEEHYPRTFMHQLKIAEYKLRDGRDWGQVGTEPVTTTWGPTESAL